MTVQHENIKINYEMLITGLILIIVFVFLSKIFLSSPVSGNISIDKAHSYCGMESTRVGGNNQNVFMGWCMSYQGYKPKKPLTDKTKEDACYQGFAHVWNSVSCWEK